MPRITKAMVLEGFAHAINILAEEYGSSFTFTLSPPSASDVSEAKALRMKLSEVKGDVDPSQIDLGKALIAEEHARRFLIARALKRGMQEEWTLEDVERIHPAVLSRLWEAVDSLTGFSSEAEETIRNFRRARKGKR
ncbi:MAG: hypothetical protein ACETWE_00290 [Candidatus Bathyarchaeia archaeon]